MAKFTIKPGKDVYQGTEEEAYESIRAINTTRRNVVLGHEIGAGAPCVKCGDACPGLDLHFWRKICRNCKCGPAEHKIADPTNHETVRKIGRLFDDDRAARYNQKKVTIATQPSKKEKDASSNVVNGGEPTINTTFDWIPQGATETIVSRYMEMIPKEAQPISGTDGAHNRNKQLHEQLPSHDQAPEFCDDLTQVEADKLKNFVQEYKDNALGVGQIQEVRPNESPILVQQMSDLMIEPPPPPPPVDDRLSENHTAPDKVEGSMQLNPSAPKLHITDNGTSDLPSSTAPVALANDRGDAIEPGSPAPQWACSKCGGSMKGGDVAVFAERAGSNTCWHPACFRCHTCSELLVDLIYFWKDDNVFCGRHYADQIRPRCAACDELIFAKEYTQAEDQNWHLKHFCCWECDTPLGGKRYVARDAHPYCLDCYQNTFAKTCSSCNLKIQADGQRLSHGDSHWHATNECFKCSGCQQSLIGKQFLPKAGYIFCSVVCKRKVLP